VGAELALESVDDVEELQAARNPVARKVAATRAADSRVRLALDRTAETLTATAMVQVCRTGSASRRVAARSG